MALIGRFSRPVHAFAFDPGRHPRSNQHEYFPCRRTPAIRFHVSLNITNLERSVAFYKILFNMEPAKLRADYAKFEPNDPPLVLSLEPNGRPGGGHAQPSRHSPARRPAARGHAGKARKGRHPLAA